MPTYRYTARDRRGKALAGTMSAPTPDVLADQLKRMGYLVTRSREVAEHPGIEALWQGWQPVSADDLVLLNVQLAKMIQVGIPLLTALSTVESQTDHRALRQVIGQVAKDVEAGQSFSEALHRHPRVFPTLFISMVKAGEISGKLDEILARLADAGQRQTELREQIKTALTYPCLLVVIGLSAIIMLITGVIPRFMKIFVEAHVALPLPTRVLYAAGQLLIHYWMILLAGLAAIAVLMQYALGTTEGRHFLDACTLRIPVIGSLVRRAGVARFARTFGMLVASGVPMLESLAIVEQTTGNAVLADVIKTVQTTVRQGGGVAEPLRASQQFPPMVVQMITIGETSGTLDYMLQHIADYYEQAVRYGIRRATALIEPCFLIVMGGVVALIMASILLPLFRLVNVIH